MKPFAAAFASTGGPKLERALRSFRRVEPAMPAIVALDYESTTYKSYDYIDADWRILTPHNVATVGVRKPGVFINGTMNTAMCLTDAEWVALFHDDVIFNPRDYLGVSRWAEWAYRRDDPDLAALTLGYAQAWAPDGYRAMPPDYWDELPLEDEATWKVLLEDWPQAEAAPQLGDPPRREPLPEYAVSYMTVPKPTPWARLGPCAQIVRRATWEKVGGFDETEGIFYDQCFPMKLRKHFGGPPRVLAVPGLVCLHLHNQSLFSDPARGKWAAVSANVKRVYGETWEEHVRRVVEFASGVHR